MCFVVAQTPTTHKHSYIALRERVNDVWWWFQVIRKSRHGRGEDGERWSYLPLISPCWRRPLRFPWPCRSDGQRPHRRLSMIKIIIIIKYVELKQCKILTGLVLEEIWSDESLIDNDRSVVLDRSHTVDEKHALQTIPTNKNKYGNKVLMHLVFTFNR